MSLLAAVIIIALLSPLFAGIFYGMGETATLRKIGINPEDYDVFIGRRN